MLRSALVRRVAPLALAMAMSGAAVAVAADPRPDNNPGSAATLTISTPTVAAGGTLAFSGTGFTTNGKGEVLMVKVDDGDIAVADNPGAPDEWGTVTAAADGTVSSTMNLARVSAITPLAPGRHWVRVLTGSKQAGDTLRSLHATFTVEAQPAGQPTPPQTGGPTPTPPVPTAPVATTPPGPIWLAETVLKRTASKKKVRLRLQAGAQGSAGTVSIRTKNAYKIGKSKKKRWPVTRTDAYFADKLGTAKAQLALTKDGLTLLARKKTLNVVVTLTDANGEDTVKQEAAITR